MNIGYNLAFLLCANKSTLLDAKSQINACFFAYGPPRFPYRCGT